MEKELLNAEEEVLKYIPDLVRRALVYLGVSEEISCWIYELISVALVFAAAYLLFLLFRYLVADIVNKIAIRTTNKWDNVFIENKVVETLTYLVPAIFIHLTISSAVSREWLVELVCKVVSLYSVWIIVKTISRILKSLTALHNMNEKARNKPYQVVYQLIYVITLFVAFLVMLHILFEQSIDGLLAGIGAFTTIVMLIFKDSILGFVAGWQLSANDQLRIGDWITVPKYGADGDVIEMSLYSVKIRNFDNTITTIPPYALISESFQNWRGMQESKGRRIKRSIYLDIHTVRFCDEQMLARYSKIEYLREYLNRMEAGLKDQSASSPIGKYVPEDGRHQTNIGIFRAYMEHYLMLNPEISKDLTCLVRQLEPSEKGVPLQVYCFVSNKNWKHYEEVQSDIFDHFLAMAPFFDLKVFQYPSQLS